jgi:hypothetical protein
MKLGLPMSPGAWFSLTDGPSFGAVSSAEGGGAGDGQTKLPHLGPWNPSPNEAKARLKPLT